MTKLGGIGRLKDTDAQFVIDGGIGRPGSQWKGYMVDGGKA